jgi:hypothetical protein
LRATLSVEERMGEDPTTSFRSSGVGRMPWRKFMSHISVAGQRTLKGHLSMKLVATPQRTGRAFRPSLLRNSAYCLDDGSDIRRKFADPRRLVDKREGVRLCYGAPVFLLRTAATVERRPERCHILVSRHAPSAERLRPARKPIHQSRYFA